MQERNQDRPHRDYDDERGPSRQRGYGRSDHDERDFGRNQSRNMSRNRSRRDYENRDFGSGGYDGYNRDNYGQERDRYESGDYDRNYAGSGRRSLRPTGGYDGAAYSGSRNYDRNDRDYGNESTRGYGGGYYSGRQGSSDNARRGYDDDYDPDDRGFLEKAGDEVMSWFGDEEAARRRERDDHRGKGPKNYTRSDSRIEEDVNDRLTDDLMVDASGISVSVSDSEVTLDGMVDSKLAKRRAEDCCDSVSGVTHVQNNLRVNRDTSDRWDRKEQSYSDSSSNKSGKKTNA